VDVGRDHLAVQPAPRRPHALSQHGIGLGVEPAELAGQRVQLQRAHGVDRARAEPRILAREQGLDGLLGRVERRAHEERRTGELTSERLGQIWLEVQGESLGPAIHLDGDYRYYWSYIPHFIHSPFYVYAYAFGDCLVNSLYATYMAQPKGFEAKYLDMLRAGGSLRHRELLKPFGLDAADPAFWNRGLSMLSGLIDELEAA